MMDWKPKSVDHLNLQSNFNSCGLGKAYTQTDYNVWRANFGQSAGSGAALPSAKTLSAAVPEPASIALLLTVLAVMTLNADLLQRDGPGTTQISGGLSAPAPDRIRSGLAMNGAVSMREPHVFPLLEPSTQKLHNRAEK